MPEESLQERFENLDWRQQLGNLASTLARISTRASHPKYDDLVASLLQEAALFVEWGAPHVPESFLLELATTQMEILAWKRAWPLADARPLLALFARNRSDRLLQMAGFLQPQ
jgi:hypothetical protein